LIRAYETLPCAVDCRKVFHKLKYEEQANVQLNTESVQRISTAYSEVRITEISEQLSRVDQRGLNEKV